MERNGWRDWLVLLLGAWLSLSPLLLNYPSTAVSAMQLTGFAIMLFALLAVLEFRAWETWVNLILATWLISAPSILGFAGSNLLAANVVLIGGLTGALALSTLTRDLK